jgi:hypothetical protein
LSTNKDAMNALPTMSSSYTPVVEEFRFNEIAKAWFARARNIALLAAGPFIGLAYVLAFPFIGLAMLVWIGLRALPKRVKNIALFFAAPFVGLAYAVAFPFVGLAMVVWIGARAMAK